MPAIEHRRGLDFVLLLVGMKEFDPDFVLLLVGMKEFDPEIF